VRITDITVVLHERRHTASASFGPARPVPLGVLRVQTDEGIEGNAFLSNPGPGPAQIAEQIVSVVKPWLLGADPLDIGRHWRRMENLSHYLSPHTVGTVDVALWDIAGKAAGLPVHRLLGTCRDRVPAYFSTAHHPSAAQYAEEARYWQGQGWKGYKLHPPRGPWIPRDAVPPVGADIEACTAVREAVGDDMTLMLDSSWSYSYTDGLRVGQAIQDLGYAWYEDPFPTHDMHNYVRLSRHLSIPLLATEITPGGLAALPPWITSGATDFLRGDVVIKGGITGLLKIARLAEAFGMNCEVHDSYNAPLPYSEKCRGRSEVTRYDDEHAFEGTRCRGAAYQQASRSQGTVHRPATPVRGCLPVRRRLRARSGRRSRGHRRIRIDRPVRAARPRRVAGPARGLRRDYRPGARPRWA
jgi:L-alanine-DL-glutamate epimerase-like enolase superfamily enzyme